MKIDEYQWFGIWMGLGTVGLGFIIGFFFAIWLLTQ